MRRPHLFFGGDERAHGPPKDCALAAENLMLAARSFGLGTCWVGFSQTWLGTEEGKAALKPSTGLFSVVAPIIVGIPNPRARRLPEKEPHIRWIRS